MNAGRLDNVDLSIVQPEHRVLFLSLPESRSIRVAPELHRAFVEYARRNPRAFPWRDSGTSAFHLLLAELLLGQTKAPDVAAIWPALIKRYPTPERLARATVRPLANFLRPLGLQNQRANALRALGRHLVRECGGQVPSAIPGLLSVPHVGLYVACAVSCFALGRRVPIVDANVLRVFGRIFGLPKQKEIRRSRHEWALAWALLPRRNVALHNYGLLDFAAEVCIPNVPRCEACDIRKICLYGISRTSLSETR